MIGTSDIRGTWTNIGSIGSNTAVGNVISNIQAMSQVYQGHVE